MKSSAVARRYAKALLLIGKEDGNAERYREELAAFARLMDENRALEQAVCNPLYETADRKKVLSGVIAKMGVSGAFRAFLLLLFEKGRIDFLKDINECYQKLADELKGIARATLVSATALSAETIEKIRQALSRKTGKEIQLDLSQDPTLIGGIVTRIGDLVLDGSIKTQLATMRESLKRGESV